MVEENSFNISKPSWKKCVVFIFVGIIIIICVYPIRIRLVLYYRYKGVVSPKSSTSCSSFTTKYCTKYVLVL